MMKNEQFNEQFSEWKVVFLRKCHSHHFTHFLLKYLQITFHLIKLPVPVERKSKRTQTKKINMQISSCVASLGASCLSVRAWALIRDVDTRDSKYENRRWAWLREQTRKFRRCHRVCVCVSVPLSGFVKVFYSWIFTCVISFFAPEWTCLCSLSCVPAAWSEEITRVL